MHDNLRFLHSPWAHATIWPVKATIRLLVRFSFWFALIILVSGVLLVAHGHVTGFDPAGTSSTVPLLSRFLAAVAVVWMPGILAAGALALFSAVRSTAVPAGSLLLLFGAWTVLLVLGGFLLAVLPPTAENSAVLPEQRLVRVDQYRFYPVRRDAQTLAPLIVYDESRDPGFTVHETAHIDPRTGELTVTDTDALRVDIAAGANSYPSMVRVPELVSGLSSDLADLARLLTVDGDRRMTTILNLIALSLFLLGCWTLARLTRWPLFNALFTLAAIRFAIWIVPAVQIGTLRSTLIVAFDSTALPFASAAILAAVALGLMALLVFLPPFGDWKREIDNG